MGWNVNKNPIEYLEQRSKYYIKLTKSFKRYLKDDDMVQKFGEEKIKRAILQNEHRVVEFQVAIEILKQTLYEKDI